MWYFLSTSQSICSVFGLKLKNLLIFFRGIFTKTSFSIFHKAPLFSVSYYFLYLSFQNKWLDFSLAKRSVNAHNFLAKINTGDLSLSCHHWKRRHTKNINDGCLLIIKKRILITKKILSFFGEYWKGKSITSFFACKIESYKEETKTALAPFGKLVHFLQIKSIVILPFYRFNRTLCNFF